MKTSSTKNAGLKINAGIRAGGLPANHNRNGLKVRTAIKAGEVIFQGNHSERLLAVG